jgi:hypothetical protein
LQADIVDISSREEPARQEDLAPEAPEDPLPMVNALVNTQDPILKTPETLALPVDTLVDLQDLQEPIITTSAVSPSLQELIVTSSATSPPPERARLHEPIATSSAITPSERVHLQEPIITSLAITPSPKQVCFIIKPFASSFPWPYQFYIFFQGLNLSELLSFDPASVDSAILEVDDHQLDSTGVAK